MNIQHVEHKLKSADLCEAFNQQYIELYLKSEGISKKNQWIHMTFECRIFWPEDVLFEIVNQLYVALYLRSEAILKTIDGYRRHLNVEDFDQKMKLLHVLYEIFNQQYVALYLKCKVILKT